MQQAVDVRAAGGFRREAVERVHPIIWRHLVTSEDALFVKKGFTKGVVGLKYEEESGEVI